jgi:hypothetical protein
MLESDLRTLFERQAARELPPAPISIPAARRLGRTRLRRRRTGTFGGPVLGAGAVITVVLAGQFVSNQATQPPPGGSTTAAAPMYFNSLRPYVRLGWLPNGVWPAQTDLSPTSLVLSFGNPAGELIAFSAGQCAVASNALRCPRAYGAVPSPTRQRLGREVGRVNGHPAYWTPNGGPILSVTGGVSSSNARIKSDTHVRQRDGALAWQYAPGGWADVYALTPGIALRIASAARFGPKVAAPLTFPVQLTGAPAAWHIDRGYEVRARDRAVSVVGFAGRAGMPAVAAAPSSGESACRQALAQETEIRTRVINGYKVYTYGASAAHPAESGLCAPDAGGLWVLLTAAPGTSDELSTLVTIFAHMRLLGQDPANWTTDPVIAR